MKVGGCWKLVYSTITILGSKRTKLGLRDFITLGDFFQTIDVQKVYEFMIRFSYSETNKYFFINYIYSPISRSYLRNSRDLYHI